MLISWKIRLHTHGVHSRTSVMVLTHFVTPYPIFADTRSGNLRMTLILPPPHPMLLISLFNISRNARRDLDIGSSPNHLRTLKPFNRADTETPIRNIVETFICHFAARCTYSPLGTIVKIIAAGTMPIVIVHERNAYIHRHIN